MQDVTRDGRWHENRRCRRKIRYETKSAAIGEVNRLYREGGPDDKFGMLTPYGCEYCRGFHVGHHSDGILADGQEPFLKTHKKR
jgi:hypothetical protein